MKRAKREVRAPVSTWDMAAELLVLLGALLAVVDEDEPEVGLGVVDVGRIVLEARLEPGVEELEPVGLAAALISDWIVELNTPVIPLRVNLAEKLI